MQHSRLFEHRFRKGKFITPLNELDRIRLESWYRVRLPEYIWLGLILDRYGRDVGLRKCASILNDLAKLAPSLFKPRLSGILALDDGIQGAFYDSVLRNVLADVLCPLTSILTYSRWPLFVKFFLKPDVPITARFDTLARVLMEASAHQSHFATDIRFLVVYFELLSGKLRMSADTLGLIMEYPSCNHDDEKMRRIRPTIRAIEMTNPNEDEDDAYLNGFWNAISRMGECELSYVKFPEEKPANAGDYVQRVHKILEYYTTLQDASHPMNNKMLVLLGIATYSYKRLTELVSHELCEEISGRGIVRVMIENYIMMKYLLKNEAAHDDIWSDFQSYGIGQYKLVLARWRESGRDSSESHVAWEYIETLVNEHMDEEFLNMDTSYFDGHNVRKKAEDVGEKELWGLYYDYDSAFEHGLWGAIRESSLLKCNSPVHQYHCVPDLGNNQKLKSVWNDCVMVMEKTLAVLEETYGLPPHLKSGVDNAQE